MRDKNARCEIKMRDKKGKDELAILLGTLVPRAFSGFKMADEEADADNIGL